MRWRVRISAGAASELVAPRTRLILLYRRGSRCRSNIRFDTIRHLRRTARFPDYVWFRYGHRGTRGGATCGTENSRPEGSPKAAAADRRLCASDQLSRGRDPRMEPDGSLQSVRGQHPRCLRTSVRRWQRLSCPVIDGGELIEAFPGACNPLKEFDVYLQSVPRLWLLVSMPGAACRLALLIGRQAVHPITNQSAVYR
jgi:hypothetical protein